MPCCLLVAAALPRPPEQRALFIFMLVVLVIGTGGHCPIRTDARDIVSRAYVASQIVEGVVKGEVRAVHYKDYKGSLYSATINVSKVLKRNRRFGRLKKRDQIFVTFRQPYQEGDTGFLESRDVNDCVVTANLRPQRKYILFLGKPNKKGDNPPQIAPPILSSKKVKRQIKKILCRNCGK